MITTDRGADDRLSNLASSAAAIASLNVSMAMSVTGKSASSNFTFDITSSTIASTSSWSSSTKIGTSSGSVTYRHSLYVCTTLFSAIKIITNSQRILTIGHIARRAVIED